MKDKEFNANGKVVKFAAVTISINGEQKDIIPAFTEFSIKRKDFSKSKVLENIDKNKILPALFAFTGTKPFRDENITLLDYNGVEIPQELDREVLVSLDKPDTINLFGVLDAPFNSVMVECNTVAEAYSRVATTFAISQMPKKDEWIGLGIATTKDNVLSQILQFANEHKMSGTMASPLEDAKFRSMDEATKLFQAIGKAFGTKYAVLTQYVKALNVSIKRYSLNEVVEVLSELDKDSKQSISDAQSNERSQLIQAILSEKIVLRRNNKPA